MATEATLVKSDDVALEKTLKEFVAAYAPILNNLIEALDEAQISHYSSGVGPKSITFDIFPASDYVKELLRLLSLDRDYKARMSSGLRDVGTRGGPNPANDFLLYLRRWAGFAEQVMRREGDQPRGIAAAKVKLLIDRLFQRLSEGKPANTKNLAFARLLENIGLVLAARKQSESVHYTYERNYVKALAVAKSSVAGILALHTLAA